MYFLRWCFFHFSDSVTDESVDGASDEDIGITVEELEHLAEPSNLDQMDEMDLDRTYVLVDENQP